MSVGISHENTIKHLGTAMSYSSQHSACFFFRTYFYNHEFLCRCMFYVSSRLLNGVELLVNKPLLNVAGYTQCRTNEGCTYVH